MSASQDVTFFDKRFNDLCEDAEKKVSAYKLAVDRLNKDDLKQQKDRYEKGFAAKTKWWYAPALLMVGSAEWMINYNSFLQTFGVPMFAIGVTLLVAGFVAFASHEHGSLCKQFEARREDQSIRGSEITALVASIFGLVLALLVIGWSRYVWTVDLISLDLDVAIWPRVLMSLGTNVIVWLLGCGAAYLAHSQAPYTNQMKELEKAKKKAQTAGDKIKKRRSKLLKAPVFRNRSQEEQGDINKWIEERMKGTLVEKV